MDQQALHQAIRDNPDDDAPRHAYADWLHANGQPARAEWIRTSCDLARTPSGEDRWHAALEREMAAFRQCRPAWWEYLSNIDQRNDRGMFRFTIGASRSSRSPTPVKRLGKAPSVGPAFAEGWLQRIELLWDDGTLGAAVAAWKGPAAAVPLFVRPAPQIGDDALRQLLALPQLEGLDLESNVLRNPAVRELARFPNLVELHVQFRLVPPDTVDAVLAQLAGMPGLRRLHLHGHDRLDYGDRPNDHDLIALSPCPGLKRLHLSSSPAITDAGIAALQNARADLAITRH